MSKRLAQLAGPYLVMAGGVVLLAFIRSQNLLAVGVLCIAGLFGFAIAFCMYRTLQRDLAALLIATSPARPFGSATGDSFEPL